MLYSICTVYSIHFHYSRDLWKVASTNTGETQTDRGRQTKEGNQAGGDKRDRKKTMQGDNRIVDRKI